MVAACLLLKTITVFPFSKSCVLSGGPKGPLFFCLKWRFTSPCIFYSGIFIAKNIVNLIIACNREIFIVRKIPFLIIVLGLFFLSSCTYIEETAPLPLTATVVSPAIVQTETPVPTATSQPSSTPLPTFTPTPTEPPLPYALQPGAMISLPAFTHSASGCAWMGVGGQVIAEDGQPVKNLVVSVTGTKDGQPAEWMGYTGLATAYGPGGYEIQLGNQAAQAVFSIQLFDLNGNPLSDPFQFTTSADCGQNLMLINFSHNLNLKPAVLLPFITR